ncbi:MAG: replicative DNA helicase [Gammaproteobacteria bacterium]|nr:replicative DNA helicase [Gammaproteobacteria bacterium]
MARPQSATSGNEPLPLRQPPHSIEAEQALLGSLLIDNNAWDLVADKARAEDFYRNDHQLIFEGIRDQADNNQPFDAVTMAEFFDRHGQSNDVGGLVYLAQLANETATAVNVVSYANIVHERSILRQLIQAGNEITGGAYQPAGLSAKDLLDQAERKVFEIAEHGTRHNQGFSSIKNILPGAMDRLDALHRSGGDITGIATGYNDFDKLTAGLQAGDLIIIAGRPSMGKTSLAMNIAEHAALGSNITSAIFSMEMSAEQLIFRMISSLGRINQGHLRTGNFTDDDWHRISGVVGQMSSAPIHIDDSPSLTPTEVRARARRLKRRHNLGLIIVDYLQLMQVGGGSENRVQEVSEISRSLKALARELEVPIIALSQLNRSVEQRTDKRPVMSDLRESGSLEQDADLIAFVFRDEVYNPDSPRKGVADIIIGKQRNGPTGTVHLTFLGQYTKFENFTPDAMASEVPISA